MAAPVPTYSAHLVASEGEAEVIIRRAIPAGIDGPHGGFTVPAGASMSDIGDELVCRGYARPALDDWKASVRYDGVHLDVALERVA